MNRYQATIRRDGDLWLIEVPELDLATAAVEHRDIRATVVDAIARKIGRPGSTVRVDLTVQLDAHTTT